MKKNQQAEYVKMFEFRIKRSELTAYAKNHTLPEIVSYFHLDKTKQENASVYDVTRSRLTRLNIPYMKIDRSALMRGYWAGKMDTICWDCERAGNDELGCPWAREFKPVPGWKIVEQPPKISSRYKGNSVYVIECPLFLEEKRLKGNI